MPYGIYQRTGDGLPLRGSIVSLCLDISKPEGKLALTRSYLRTPGVCSGGTKPLLKRVAAVAGDIVERGELITVNRNELTGSVVLKEDSMGRPWPYSKRSSLTLKTGELWVMGEAKRSFDSRYFGQVKTSQVLAVYKPLILF